MHKIFSINIDKSAYNNKKIQQKVNKNIQKQQINH